MEDCYVRLERDGPVAVVRLDRPPVNALELELATQGAKVIDDLAASDARAVVLTGTGSCFSAGLDLRLVPTYGAEQQRALVAAANRFLTSLYSFSRPVVAAVNGHAIAGGFVLLITSDYRIGPRGEFKIGMTEARAGIPFPAAALEIVRAQLPPPAARVLTLVARNVDPERARGYGALDELEPPERVLPRAMDVARDLAGIPAAAYASIKNQLRGALTARLEDMIARGTDPMLSSWLGSESAGAARRLLRRGRTG